MGACSCHEQSTFERSMIEVYAARYAAYYDCNYTCHHKCRQLVTLDCTNPAHEVPVETSLISRLAQQSSTLSSPSAAVNNGNGSIQCDTSESGISTCSELSETGVPLPITKEELKALIETFNRKSQGLQIVLHHDGETFRGFIRVHMELHRPINIVAGNRPASIFDIMAGDTFEKRRTRTSFYIPKDTIKALHITSETTASEVIEALLKKFKVSDNPLKFALYERYTTDRHKIVIRRLSAEERPLWLCLQWGKANARSLVLQENETGEVMWDVFSVPELENFLRILDKEEEEYTQQVQARYALKKRRIQDALARFECNHLSSEEPILV